MAVCCTEGCWEGVRPLVWVYLQLLVQQQVMEKQEEVVAAVVVVQELHSPVKTGGRYISWQHMSYLRVYSCYQDVPSRGAQGGPGLTPVFLCTIGYTVIHLR